MSDPTVLSLINQRLERMEKNQTENTNKLFDKLETVCTTQTDLMITDETIKAKIASVEMMNANTQRDIQELQIKLDEHKGDGVTHYNSNYYESLPQKLWRKKPEIAAGGTLGTALATLIYFLIQYFGG